MAMTQDQKDRAAFLEAISRTHLKAPREGPSEAEVWAEKFSAENRRTISPTELVNQLQTVSATSTTFFMFYDRSTLQVRMARKGNSFLSAKVKDSM